MELKEIAIRLLQNIDSYNFECEAGPLSHCAQYIELKGAVGIYPIGMEQFSKVPDDTLVRYAANDAQATVEYHKAVSAVPQVPKHVIKSISKYFQQTWDELKPFEIRKNDRDYRVGDKLLLQECNQDGNEYLGRKIHATITYITNYAQKKGYVAMGIKINRKEESPYADEEYVKQMLKTVLNAVPGEALKVEDEIKFKSHIYKLLMIQERMKALEVEDRG